MRPRVCYKGGFCVSQAGAPSWHGALDLKAGQLPAFSVAWASSVLPLVGGGGVTNEDSAEVVISTSEAFPRRERGGRHWRVGEV